MIRWLRVSLILLCMAATVHAAQARRPNVLLILADDLGYGDLACYGAKDMRTPNIDALAAAGRRFDNFYANCPVCSPTRAALLSGRYQELVGVPGVIRTSPRNNWGYLSPAAVLLPELLRKAGYRSAIVGKWHLGLKEPNTPNERGFDHFHGFLGDMMDDYYHHRRHGINYMRLNERQIDPRGHATDLFSQWASEFLRRQSADRPFFLYLAYNAPHTPIQPPDEWVEKVRRREAGIDNKRARLVALIEHLDAGIGQVMKTLHETGLVENTLVLFTSDNGGQLSVGAHNGPLRDGKQSMYEGGIKVPLIAAWPGKISPGSTASRIAITMDLMPTIREAAGLKVEHPIDGHTILPTLLGKQPPPLERTLFWTRREGGGRYMGKTTHAVRQGDWKLVHNSPYAPLELYNLREDPREENNLAQSHRTKFRQLGSALRAHIQRGGSVPWQPPR